MANFIDYCKYYGDKSFSEVPFNDVDALILAELSYLNFSEVISTLPNTIEKVSRTYFNIVTNEKIKSKKNVYKYAHNLLGYVKSSTRFKDIIMLNYSRVVDTEKQFGAITFSYNDWIYISYEGTNEYMSGWREDFDLSNKFPVPSQTLAIHYLNNEAKNHEKIYVGGHSKGGNLAVVAAMETTDDIRQRIVTVYDFDGPGMRKKEFLSKKYRQLLPKIKKFTPEVSIIGMLLYSEPNYFVVQSSMKGILQHHAISWQCFGSYFIPATQSESSLNFSKATKEFLENNTEEDIREFVASIFAILEKSNITNTETVTIKKILTCINLVRELPAKSKTKDKLIKLFNILLGIYMPKNAITTKKKS